MEYVVDFVRLLGGGVPSRSRGRRRGGEGRLRLVLLGLMLGLAWPTIRGWRAALPDDLGVSLPHGLQVSLPAGIELGLPAGWRAVLPGVGAAASGAAAVADAVKGTDAAKRAVGRDAGHPRFETCRRGAPRRVRNNCVVDGDTFRLRGARIRIADIDTPETHPPRCAREARLGRRATRRLQALLNAGPVTLARYKRDRDRYGRQLRVVTRNGRSLGDTLIAEGLARAYDGGRRRGWCGIWA